MTLLRLEDALIRDGLRGATIAAAAYGGANSQESTAERAWADSFGIVDPLGGTVLGDKLMRSETSTRVQARMAQPE